MKLEKPTTVDVVLSCLVPFWGFLIGVVALFKREYRRGLTMIGIASAVLAIVLVVNLERFNAKVPPQATTADGKSARAAMPSIETQLLEAANQITRSAPTMVDANTRLDGAIAGPGLTFTYLYTFPTVNASQLSPSAFDAQVAPSITKNACASGRLSPFFANNVQVRFEYRAANGTQIGVVKLLPHSCDVE